MNKITASALCFLMSCMPVPDSQDVTSRAESVQTSPIDMRIFSDAAHQRPTRPNREIAQDFLDLSFRMESGRTIPYLTRFEGPIRVRTTGDVSDIMLHDLKILLGRLRSEARIDITMDQTPSAEITVEAISRATLQRAVPQAACFVVPRISSWSEFQRVRRTPQVDWATLTHRDRATIFVPSDVAPQEIRDCLHEELAQALGPLNDLYRLPDSVFNDDNIHTVLTGFDMLILRMYYAPALRNGMTRTEVASRLPELLAQLNPRGQWQSAASQPDTSRDWIEAIETALSSAASPTERRNAAAQAIQIGNAFDWQDARGGFAQYAYGRLQVGRDAQAALAAFNAAENLYQRDPNTRIHAAHIAVQKAAFALAAGDAESVLRLTDSAMDVAIYHQNAALVATLMMFQAEAHMLMGNADKAEAIRLDSTGWARYGFGSSANVRARLDEIAALRPF